MWMRRFDLSICVDYDYLCIHLFSLLNALLFWVFQPGPRENTVQCFIKRDRTTSTYQLFLGLPPSECLVTIALSNLMEKMLRLVITSELLSFV